MPTCFSGTAGGGGCGEAVGIARATTTGAGAIITMFRLFISMWTRDGEDITGTTNGTGTAGTTNGFRTSGFEGTGGAGIAANIGKGAETGASGTISRFNNNGDRS